MQDNMKSPMVWRWGRAGLCYWRPAVLKQMLQ